MPEPTTFKDHSDSPLTNSNGVTASTPLELLKAVKEVQERRVAVWREYDDAFDTFLSPSSSSSLPVNGSQHNPDPVSYAETSGRGCAGCSTTTIPLSEDLLAQIMQITTQALIECSHRLRIIQTELNHSSAPHLARLVDAVQLKENALLRNVVQRDQLRKTTLRPALGEVERDDEEARGRIAQLDGEVKSVRGEIAELMQEVYAEGVELQLADG